MRNIHRRSVRLAGALNKTRWLHGRHYLNVKVLSALMLSVGTAMGQALKFANKERGAFVHCGSG